MLATSLLLRWSVLVAVLLALGYVTKFSEDFSRRVIVTWVLMTPLLLVMLLLLLQEITRALLRDAAQARRAVIVGCTAGSTELARRLERHGELGDVVLQLAGDPADQLCPAKQAEHVPQGRQRSAAQCPHDSPGCTTVLAPTVATPAGTHIKRPASC